MLFCIDIGNTHTVIGAYEGDKFVNQFRITTDVTSTYDEVGIKIVQLLRFNNVSLNDKHNFIVSSVVPKMDFSVMMACKKYFGVEPLFVGPGIKSGIKIKLDDPKQLGADILVGAVGATTKYGTNVLVIDMGTAMTFVYINDKMELIGGSIIPGMRTAFSGLFEKTAKLEAIGFDSPKGIIGTDTRSCLQSGMVYGWCSIVEGMIEKYQSKLGKFKVIITGGEANQLEPYLDKKYQIIHDDKLILDGLKIVYDKNRKQ